MLPVLLFSFRAIRGVYPKPSGFQAGVRRTNARRVLGDREDRVRMLGEPEKLSARRYICGSRSGIVRRP